MTIEAEIKARLVDARRVRGRLDDLAVGIVEVYRDTYLDSPEGWLDAADAELRVRTVVRPDGTQRHLLTFKGPPVDEVTHSRPERESAVADPRETLGVLAGLGYRPVLAFSKECVNYRFARDGRDFLATMVTVPELDGTFLEVETQASNGDLTSALAAIRAIFADLGVDEDEVTTDTYTDAVRAARS